jgi:hypothetical protein
MISSLGDSGGDVPMGIANLGGDISIANPDFNGMNLGGDLGLVSIANPDVNGANFVGLVSIVNSDFGSKNLRGDGLVSIVNPISFFFLVFFNLVSIGEKFLRFIIIYWLK